MSATETGVDTQSPVEDTSAGLSPWARAKAILGGSAGNLVEWYDWFAYASFSIYFAPVFFPEGDATAQYMKTALVFALGFLARPVGAWLMGLYADRAGRKAALTLSVGMMCLGSLVIALTPGYAQIGVAAPVVLLGARLLQHHQHGCRRQLAHDQRHVLEARPEAAALPAGHLAHVGGAGAVLAADREALQQSRAEQDDRRRDPDLGVAGG